jgi:hypothetical protein
MTSVNDINVRLELILEDLIDRGVEPHTGEEINGCDIRETPLGVGPFADLCFYIRRR